MRKILGAVVLGMMLAATTPVQADTFVWKDPKNDFTMSFPDVWRIQTEDSGMTRLRIAGPLAEDSPTCSMQVADDGRANIYPKRLVDEAVVHLLDEDFWRDQIGQFKKAQLAAYYAPASMGGKGDATAIKFAYVDANNTPMYGVMIGSVYGGKRYVVGCSSKTAVYERWADLFASIMDSVELKSKYHPFANGYYRDFLADPKLALPRVKPGTLHKNSFWWDENRYVRDQFIYNR